MTRKPSSIITFRWLLGVALLLQTGDSSQVLTVQAGQQSVVLVALDGFHPSYLDRPVSRHLQSVAQGGVRARWLVPVFPTKTFPNFHSIATGLYPEHHGIVSNNMRDPVLGRFALWERDGVRDPRWWGGEPIWVTAVRQGRRAASFFWPGSDVAIQGVRPHHYRKYDRKVSTADRVRQVLEWLALEGEQSLSLITLYLDDVDYASHDFGPEAPETDSAIARVDSAVGALMSGIRARRLEQRVNVVVVSDHGMARVDPSKVVYLDDFVSPDSIDLIDEGPFVSIAPFGISVDELYQRLSRAHPRLTIYRKSEVPAAYRYRSHPRIPPIIGTLSDGWTATTRRAAAERERVSLGEHGYPPERESMRAIFLADGPAFRDGVVVEPFQNIHVYALLAHVLGLTPAPNDGRLDSVRVMLAGAVRTGRVENAIEIAPRHAVAALRYNLSLVLPERDFWNSAHPRAEHGVPSSDFSRATRWIATQALRVAQDPLAMTGGWRLATGDWRLTTDTQPPEAETARHTARPAPPAPRGSPARPAPHP